MIHVPTNNEGDVRLFCKLDNFTDIMNSLMPFVEKLIWREHFNQHLPYFYRQWGQFGLRYYKNIEGAGLQRWTNEPSSLRLKVRGYANINDPIIASNTFGICEAKKIPQIGDWVLGYSAEDKTTEEVADIKFYDSNIEHKNYSELDFTDWIPGTELLQSLFQQLNLSNFGRVRLMNIPQYSCYGYHVDGPNEWRMHIPLITHTRSFLVLDDKLWHLPVGNVYLINTTKRHTAINAGDSRRIHLVTSYSNSMIQ